MDMMKLENEHAVIKYFKEVSLIPRASGNEKGISDMLASFSKEWGCTVIQDEFYNLIIRKPASAGYEAVPSVIIQGHLDMVCEKGKGSNHDFSKDPISLRQVGDMIYADGTSLGADNGIALAYAMSIIASDEIKHPELEFVFTVQEESTMYGAENLDTQSLTSRMIINLDSEEEGILCVSSAGGSCATHTVNIEWQDNQTAFMPFDLTIEGLKGGHSGDDIVHARANAIKLLGRILYNLSSSYSLFEIVSISGGLQDNAIPREAEARILLDIAGVDDMMDKVSYWNKILKEEYQVTDSNVAVSLKPVPRSKMSDMYFNDVTKKKVINTMLMIPDGIVCMDPEIVGLPRSSTNLGVLTTGSDEVIFESLVRSSMRSELDLILNRMKALGEIIGCAYKADGFFPYWSYKANSKLKDLFCKVYKEKYDDEIVVQAVHGGLECGFFTYKLPEVDIVSYGPNIYDAHTDNEHISLSSVLKTWDYLKEVLREMINWGDSK